MVLHEPYSESSLTACTTEQRASVPAAQSEDNYTTALDEGAYHQRFFSVSSRRHCQGFETVNSEMERIKKQRALTAISAGLSQFSELP